jgi:hypothetical protein
LNKFAAFGFMCSQFRNRYRYNSLRYSGRDYSLPGKYFVTICTAMKTEWFGKVVNGKMQLSEIGIIACQMWYEIPIHFPYIGLDAFVVMPNYIHGIIVINSRGVVCIAPAHLPVGLFTGILSYILLSESFESEVNHAVYRKPDQF